MLNLQHFFWLKLIAIFFSLAVTDSMANAKSLSVGLWPFPPAMMADETKIKAIGQIPDNLAKVLKEANLESEEFKIYPVKRAIMMVLFGRNDISVTARGHIPGPIKLAVSSSKNGIFKVRMCLFSTKGKPVDTLDNLVGMQVLVNSGYDYGDTIREFLDDKNNKIIRNESPSHESAFKKLLYGRGDYYVGYALPIESLMENNPSVKAKAQKVDLRYRVLETLDVVVLMSKMTTDSKNKLYQIDQAIERLKSRGELKDN